MKIGTTVLLSCSINSAIKGALKAPRPYQYSSSNFNPETYKPGKLLDPETGKSVYSDSPVFRVEESGYSTPSGHSQCAAAFWPMFAADMKWKKVWKILLAILLPLLVAISRNYLGVHYPTDVLMGLCVGYIFAVGSLLWGNKISSLFKKLNKIYRILILAVITVILNLLCPEDTSMAGAFFGFTVGYILMDDGKKFDASEGKWWQKLLRLCFGAVLVGIIYLGLKMVFPGKEAPWGQFCRFIRYGLTGFFITFVCPLLFVLCKLGKPESASKAEDTSKVEGDSKTVDALSETVSADAKKEAENENAENAKIEESENTAKAEIEEEPPEQKIEKAKAENASEAEGK